MKRGIPEGEENEVPHNQANQPEGRKIDVPVPGITGLRLKAAQERIIHNGRCSILDKGADVQEIPPVASALLLGTTLLFDAPHLLLVALKVTCVTVGAYKTVLDG